MWVRIHLYLREKERMDARLHEAALMGRVDYLNTLVEENAYILDGAADFAETPLHIAALFGHIEFAKAVLSRKPELARVLDSERSSPLHLASAKGHVEMVKELLQIDTDMCLVRDKDGRTPLHAAVLKGRVEVVKELVGAKWIATRVLTDRREPILHLCVNHDQFEIVRTLLEYAKNGEDDEFLKMMDDNDNSILHLAVAKKHIPLTKFLLQKTKMRAEVNALNAHGFTAFDVLLQNRRKSKDMKLEGILRGAGAKRADAIHHTKQNWTIRQLSPRKNKWQKHLDWLNETRSGIMVVAVLISTVTFQAGTNPPGGFWQDDKTDGSYNENHTAGNSIMAQRYPGVYLSFTVFNAIAFVASLIIILLLISGFPIKRRIFMWALMIITWLSMTSMIVTYSLAHIAIATRGVLPLGYVSTISFLVWLGLNGILFIAHFFRFIIWSARKVTTLIYACIYRN
ncbi:ankyrin repeat-containing protein At5g02620-like [Magnolia sinica]|uniref:ankyrin repeat-containing protein At5g02620-like n=1 Tax=Magnolia sinica TaxID=86752 RepID=UPI002658C7C8|nr:ankyrin repeat-containing protein At5g02620-like [Magnolia sinica]